jgi:hypothetical protein
MEYKNLAECGSNLVRNSGLLIKNLKDIIDNAKIVIFQFVASLVRPLKLTFEH